MPTQISFYPKIISHGVLENLVGQIFHQPIQSPFVDDCQTSRADTMANNLVRNVSNFGGKKQIQHDCGRNSDGFLINNSGLIIPRNLVLEKL